MSAKLTWLGHATWLLNVDDTSILIDPFLNDSPVAPMKSEQVNAQYILVSHGHADHCADAADIANRCGATILSNYEITTWFAQKHRVKQTIGMNLGGGVNLPFGRVTLTLAFHSSQMPDGSYGGNPGGFLISLPRANLYFACDTALFSDMKLIGAKGLDVAVLPIGDLFTMGPEDSLEAIKLLNPRRVVPSHFNTWPPINQDARAWSDRVRETTPAEPVVLKPGDSMPI